MNPARGRSGWAGFAACAAIHLGLLVVVASIEALGAAPALPFPGGGRIPAGSLILLYLAVWTACAGLFICLPTGVSFRTTALVILSLAALARATVLPMAASDDVNRYLWEGRLVTHGLSPYQHPPVVPAGRADRATVLRDPMDPLWAGINHPEMTAIYPPVALGLFAAVAAAWYDPLAIKLAMAGFDLGAIVLLLAILRRRGSDPRWALWYALNPLPIIAFAGRGHLDAVQVLLLLGAIALYERQRWGWMFLALGLAVQIKYVALLALPFFVRRDNFKHVLLLVVAAGVPFLPFVGGADGGAVFASLLRFGHEMAFNGFAHGLLRGWIGDLATATRVAQVLFAAVWTVGLVLWWQVPATRRDPVAGVLFAIGAFFVFAPTVHFWYLPTIVALAALVGSPVWLVASATIGFSLVADGLMFETGEFAYSPWAQAAVWTLPGLLLMMRLRRRWWPHFAPPHSVSVVIPTRNEERWIAESVRAAAADPSVAEVLVVDGGSTDATSARAASAGATVIEAPASCIGRGRQIAHGLDRACGDMVAVVHADVVLAPGSLEQAREFLVRHPDVVGGALGSEFDARDFRLRLVERANRARAALTGIAFGDQVQFFRREPVVAAAIYPAIPLMEDVELSLRLGRLGRRVFLWQSNCVSARRWRRERATRALTIVWLVAVYLLRRLVGTPDAEAMYRTYYDSTPADDRPAEPAIRCLQSRRARPDNGAGADPTLT